VRPRLSIDWPVQSSAVRQVDGPMRVMLRLSENMRRSIRSSEKKVRAGRVGCALIGLAFAATGYAQDAVPTNAELRARVTALTQENAFLQRDIKMLTGVCQAQTAAVPSAPNPDVARQQAELDAFNRESVALEQAAREHAGWLIKDLEFGATESNRVWVRYSWKAVIHNSLDHAKVFDLDVQFLDARGLIVDHAVLYRQGVAAFDERTVTGTHLVSMPGATTVASIHVVATPR
jgi:hypothetical protein